MIDVLVLFGKGAAVGFSVSAPVGPIGIMCIRRTLSHGPRWGMAVGLGAATADMIYASTAALGLGAVARFLMPWETPLRLLAGCIVGALAIRALRATTVAVEDRPVSSVAGTYVTSFGLVLSNPAAVAIFTGVFVGLGLTSVDQWKMAVAIVLGVVSGAVTWWVVLTTSLTLLRRRVDDQWLRRVNLVSGVSLALISVLIFGSVIL